MNSFAKGGYDTRSIFKRNLTVLNSELSFPNFRVQITACHVFISLRYKLKFIYLMLLVVRLDFMAYKPL